MSVNSPQSSIDFRCRDCGRKLGRYRWVWTELSGALHAQSFLNNPRRPRTGTGLYVETYDRREYIRVICKCGPNGRNEKLGPEALGQLRPIGETVPI